MCKPFCKTILHYLAWVAIVGNIFLILLTGFWLYYPYKLPYVQQPIEILNENKEIRIGEPIKMKLYVSKQQELISSSRPNITCNDGNLVTLAPATKTLPKGEYSFETEAYTLPPKVSIGSMCKFNFVNTYDLNPIRSETVTWSSGEFKVKAKE